MDGPGGTQVSQRVIDAIADYLAPTMPTPTARIKPATTPIA